MYPMKNKITHTYLNKQTNKYIWNSKILKLSGKGVTQHRVGVEL